MEGYDVVKSKPKKKRKRKTPLLIYRCVPLLKGREEQWKTL
jgi:hypothetical protein